MSKAIEILTDLHEHGFGHGRPTETSEISVEGRLGSREFRIWYTGGRMAAFVRDNVTGEQRTRAAATAHSALARAASALNRTARRQRAA